MTHRLVCSEFSGLRCVERLRAKSTGRLHMLLLVKSAHLRVDHGRTAHSLLAHHRPLLLHSHGTRLLLHAHRTREASVETRVGLLCEHLLLLRELGWLLVKPSHLRVAHCWTTHHLTHHRPLLLLPHLTTHGAGKSHVGLLLDLHRGR